MKPIGKYYEEKKLYQSLYGHTYDSLAFLKGYLHKEFTIIKTFCNRWQIKEADLIKSLFLTILLHDVGKLTKTFQKNILAGKHTFYMPHPLAGLPILIEFQNHFSKLLEDVAPSYLEITAVLSHHTQAYSGLYSTTDCKTNFETESVNNFMKEVVGIYDKLEFGNYFKKEFTEIKIDCPNRKSDELKNGVDCLKEINGNKIAIKAIFSFIFSLLKMSDILASINFVEKIKNENIKEPFVFDELYNPNNQISFSGITNKMGTWHQKSKRPFQENLYNNPKPFTMLFAPCGRGKTDASLYWATELIEKSGVNRIIFALPTQVTCNAMFNTLSSNDYFGKNKVGLYHSRSILELSEKEKERYKEGQEEVEDHQSFVKDETFKGEIFFYPVTVTTVDHLLYAFIHGYSKADFSLGNIQTSAVIFDEIHYYDDTMLSNLKQLFGILRQMKIPHLLMSGTFPEFLQSEINISKEYHLEEDHEGLGFTPFEIIKKEKPIITNDVLDKEAEAEMIACYKNGLKQFIILNTIQSAQLTYIQLKECFKKIGNNKPNMILLHSRFIYSDRRDIEKEILRQAKAEKEIQENNTPFILVATQVIEVSLDISSHRLYTECAPVDAIGQRGGRLNRGGQNAGKNRMILFKTSNAKPYDDGLLENSWTAIPEGIVNYLDFKNACDEVYNGRCISHSDFDLSFRECTLFGRSPKEIRWNEDKGKVFKTRKEDYQTIDVYPIEFFHSLGDELFKTNNEVIKVPAWWYWYDKKENRDLFCEHVNENRTFILCKLPYNKVLGLSTINSRHEKIEQQFPQIM